MAGQATSVDGDGVKKAMSDLISKTGEQFDKFNDSSPLVTMHPDAGNWPTAQWLERLVDDRRNALVEHANRLHTMFTTMSQQLDKVVRDLSGTDQDNAAALNDIQDMRGTISQTVSNDDAQTEVGQTNFSNNGKDPADNNSDGDGYDDNLTEKIGQPDPPAAAGDQAPPPASPPPPAPPPPPSDSGSGGGGDDQGNDAKPSDTPYLATNYG